MNLCDQSTTTLLADTQEKRGSESCLSTGLSAAAATSATTNAVSGPGAALPRAGPPGVHLAELSLQSPPQQPRDGASDAWSCRSLPWCNRGQLPSAREQLGGHRWAPLELDLHVPDQAVIHVHLLHLVVLLHVREDFLQSAPAPPMRSRRSANRQPTGKSFEGHRQCSREQWSVQPRASVSMTTRSNFEIKMVFSRHRRRMLPDTSTACDYACCALTTWPYRILIYIRTNSPFSPTICIHQSPWSVLSSVSMNTNIFTLKLLYESI